MQKVAVRSKITSSVSDLESVQQYSLHRIYGGVGSGSTHHVSSAATRKHLPGTGSGIVGAMSSKYGSSTLAHNHHNVTHHNASTATIATTTHHHHHHGGQQQQQSSSGASTMAMSHSQSTGDVSDRAIFGRA